MSGRKETRTTVISTRTEIEIQQRIDEAGQLRGHTRSQALEAIIKLGLPLYIKNVRRKFQPIKSQRVDLHRAVVATENCGTNR